MKLIIWFLRDMNDTEARQAIHEWLDFVLDKCLPGRRTQIYID